MSERERLIELIKNGFFTMPVYEALCTNKRKASEYLADFLLENGVIVPPVKVGDTVYVICNCAEVDKELDGTLWDTATGGYGTATGYYCPFEYECEVEECSDTNKIFETVVTYIYCNDFSECKKWEMYVENLKPTFLFSDFGKTVFTNGEAAEKVLKEREQNG